MVSIVVTVAAVADGPLLKVYCFVVHNGEYIFNA